MRGTVGGRQAGREATVSLSPAPAAAPGKKEASQKNEPRLVATPPSPSDFGLLFLFPSSSSSPSSPSSPPSSSSFVVVVPASPPAPSLSPFFPQFALVALAFALAFAVLAAYPRGPQSSSTSTAVQVSKAEPRRFVNYHQVAIIYPAPYSFPLPSPSPSSTTLRPSGYIHIYDSLPLHTHVSPIFRTAHGLPRSSGHPRPPQVKTQPRCVFLVLL